MEIIQKYLSETWVMTAQLAPWLLVGFALAGLISTFLRRSMVTRLLGKPGLGSMIKAALIGVPLPLCSCGVIPVAAAIREKGASKGATAAFLASTPETGIDSAIATWGMLGPLMAVIRVLLAFVTGITAGLFVQFATRNEKDAHVTDSSNAPVEDESRPSFRAAIKYAFVTMPRDMAPSLITGLLIAGAISAFIPADFFASFGASGVMAYLVVTLVAVPLYVCSTGSIPLALAMVQAGFSPGCALVFLLAGPATNVATITTMNRYLGPRAIIAYLLAIIGVAWAAGAAIDFGLGRDTIMGQMPHHMESASMVGMVAGVILVGLIGWGLVGRIMSRFGARKSCCEAESSSSKPSCSCEKEKARATHSCCCKGKEGK